LNFGNLSKEKLNLALKYQILNKYTSLFAEVELSEKASTKMKSYIIGNKEKNIIIRKKPSYGHFDYDARNLYRNRKCCLFEKDEDYMNRDRDRSRSRERERDKDMDRCFLSKKKNLLSPKIKEKRLDKKTYKSKSISSQEDLLESQKKEEDSKKDLKDDVMKIINTQNFIEGYWSENKQTKIIKEKYQKEYNLIKNLKNEKINDNVAITIIIIYFIYNEHFELLKELSRIIKKAKLFIKKEIKISYEQIIKDIGIN
jgi:hypothetical protein